MPQILLKENIQKIINYSTTLRDAHQSLLATRMTTKEMLPKCEKLNA